MLSPRQARFLLSACSRSCRRRSSTRSSLRPVSSPALRSSSQSANAYTPMFSGHWSRTWLRPICSAATCLSTVWPSASPWRSARRLVAFSCRLRQTPSGGVARLPRCWPEPSCFDSAAAFPNRSAKHSQVLGRRQRPRQVLPRESHGDYDIYDVLAVIPFDYPERNVIGEKKRNPFDQVVSAERFGSPLG